MGKWSDLKEKYPRFQPHGGEEGDHFKKVGKVIAVMRAMAVEEKWSDVEFRKYVQNAFKDLRQERDALKERMAKQGVEMDACQTILLEIMEENELTLLRDDEGWSFGEEPQPYASITDRQAFDEWSKESGWIEQYTLPWQTLNAKVKELLEGNEPLPPGVGVWWKNKIKLYRPR